MTTRSSRLKTFASVCTGTVFAVGAMTASLSAQPSSDRIVSAAMQEQCDRMAGSPYDLNRNQAFSPVSIEQIDGAAVAACSIAFKETQNPRFAFQLGRALNKTEHADQAMSAYETAVNADYSAAKVNLGMLLGRLGDQESEFRMYSQAADAGNVLAAYNLGVAYRDGLGTRPDAAKAIHWFEFAAAHGDDTAAFNLGAIYDEGKLVPEDNQMAIAWYDVAAKRGSTDAMINLGLMYEAGEGIQANPERAAQLYADAASQGDTFGAQKLMEMQQAGLLPKTAPEDEPQVAANANGLDMLVLEDGDVVIPSTLLEI
ncbi:tetratricopeptide repeat protein [Rhizobium helianthi]|uniref:Tetratricopeptide repeat protein n=1 Tax=Rhizobium helianthi TaxID=1132695 RepID=A0ABW4M319_9HYPH